MFDNALQSLTEALLDAAAKAGAQAADAIAVRSASVSVDIRAGQLEQAERAESVDVGLRVLIGQRQACVSSSLITGPALAEMSERAVAMARAAPEDPHIGLAAPEQLAPDRSADALELHDPSDAPDPASLEDTARTIETAALAIDGVSQVEQASAYHSDSAVHLAASNGFSGGYRRTSWGRSCSAIAGTGLGMERDYAGDSRIFAADLRDASEIGAEAGTRAAALLNARKPPTGTFAVLFDERVASSLIGHLLVAANGTGVARGSSWLRDALGTPVLPDGLDLIEDPHRRRVPASRPFDAEGLATQRRVIVEGGVLRGFTLDLSTARKLGMPPTANAARGTSAPPSPAAWNVALTQGSQTRAELIVDMGTGLLVTSMIGATINPNTGDYSRGASGFWIERGEIAYPVNECTIAGNLRDMLRAIVPANDARTWLSRVVPSLLVPAMTVAGT